jgi:integrase
MPKRKPLINDTAIKNATGPARYSCGGDGLYLDVKASGKRSFYLRIMIDGKIYERGLGAYIPAKKERGASASFGLKDARAKAREWADELRSGNNVGTRAKKKAAPVTENITFKQAAETVMALRDPTWKSDVHREQWHQTMGDYIYPVIGGKAVSAITLEDIETLLKPYWTEKHETMRNVRSRIAIVLDWAVAKKLRTDNPARELGALKTLLGTVKKSVKHHKALPYTEIQSFLATLRTLDSVSALALEFAILTTCRTSEVLGAKLNEIDGTTWTIPASRMKANATHVVPLSPAAMAVLDKVRELPSPDGWIFPSRASHLSNMAMLMCLKGLQSDLTVHGFRSTFRDWAADKTDYPHEIVEAALAHTVSNDVVRAYRRTSFFDKRRDLMNAWADYCDGKEPIAPMDEVAELKAQIAALREQLAAE